MQIVIAMSGFGERFRRAGYDVPKPLIEVEGKPIIAHVVDLFPGDNDFIFICNNDHLAEPAFRMREILEGLTSRGRIVGIASHKLGPVNAVLQAADAIDPAAPTVINYCDFTCYWDFEDFTRFVDETECDGAIPAYTGFHPHMLGSTNYAYVREDGGWVFDIQEKKPYTDDPGSEYASSGTYYFKTGGMALHYCRETVNQGIDLGGEYYVSLVYKPMLADRRRIAVYPLQHFMQWGTPHDLADYNAWSRLFRRLNGPRPTARQTGAILVPMAGLGSRFARKGYAEPKPLIPVSGVPMAVQATRDLPSADQTVFVLRRTLPSLDRITAALDRAIPGSRMIELEGETDGQARTCLLGLDGVDPDAPLTIGACDNGVVFDAEEFERQMADPAVDLIVWGYRGHANAARNPAMYGWIDVRDGGISGVSVKRPLADTARDPVIIGTFTFKRARDFTAAAERMIARDGRVNGEFYVDACVNDAIALGLRCVLFEVDAYLCWGTPDELRSFEYWQSCFHKWPSHPYRLEHDGRVPASAVDALDRRFAAQAPVRPGVVPCVS
ncbi:hypothetical protein N825_34825 [Skermanella stibiiresistens SB22]|uniref:Nucleotidyl transferase domain-containing protein n=1 Tax=Skermanella stibiiresistens SB22 TaxID=1385369 RepID=W9H320_9PROT|nr:NTP transferase domain-containing protein [Skermanella stibiiresistens]EWY40469.1 hypothetical protein N825_34825 [Skermanella stibiiresistens SB22]